ncbi:hypothetical protein [Enterococcus sp. CWB-B31]|uniref:hypothetical protein n=1 Tax=Enterococcus sp. CWB-B31 TaxID=2885159 RepID=UPI001E5E0CEA|nr:hypothetical protein [Enterococcus sp. CWB-B31]MCB5953666.1 hypothetical protein [Enterococcus sp. CWB-B31]
MRKSLISKFLAVGIIGVFGLTIGAVNSNAATFEEMKENVESDNGWIYNPESDTIMGNEASKQFIEIVETGLENSNDENVTQEMFESAFDLLEDTDDVIDKPFDPTAGLIQPRGVYVPTQPKAVPSTGYQSNEFSGAGWRYSGFLFVFNDYNANPFFGVRATKDSFNFHLQTNGNYYPTSKHVVPANGGYLYYPSRSGGKNLNGYFSTYNPVNGSRYYII